MHVIVLVAKLVVRILIYSTTLLNLIKPSNYLQMLLKNYGERFCSLGR